MSKRNFVKSQVNVKLTPGKMLRILRELQELSQEELADLTKMTQSNISALETGSRQIGRERALVLAKALKVHPSVILFPDFDMSEVA